MEPDDPSDDGTLLGALIELVSGLSGRLEWGDALVDLLERLTRARRLDAPLMRRVLATLDAAGACEGREGTCATACELMREHCGRCERDKRCEATWENVCHADSARCN